MSMINTSLLNEIVNEKGITKPSDILFEVRKGIINALKQTGEIGQQKDGMDAVLCALSKNGSDHWSTFECALANNAVFIIRTSKNPVIDGEKKLEPVLEDEEKFESVVSL